MKLKNKITKVGIIALASLTLTVGVAAAAASSIKPIEAGAYYSPSTHYSVSDTASELASYYSTISDSDTGTSLLSKLQSLNSTKRKKTVGYSTMGTGTSGAFIYTDYDLNNTATDSNGQTYGTKVASFYTKTSATSWNREHVWPNSHGGDNVEADILHTRPTITSENSSRGNSFYVEGKNSSTAGWDPYTAGYDAEVRGECARIILYSVVAYSGFSLSSADSHSTSNSNPDNMMGNMHTLIKWHYQYSPNVYEINRNNGAEYLQGNRNPFVDHPEYVARIWSDYDSTVSSLVSENESMYDNWTPGSASSYGSNDAVDESSDKVTLDKTSASIAVDETTTITATSSNGASISWTTSNSSVASISSSSSNSGSSITVTGNAAGTATITASATINGSTKTKSCTVTVTSSGSSGGSTTSDATILPTDLGTSYPSSETAYTTATGSLAIKAYQVANYSSKIQFHNGDGYLYNTDSLNLSSLTISGASNSNLKVYAGSSANPSGTALTASVSGSDYTYDLSGKNYFKVAHGAGGYTTCSSISVTLGSGGSSTTKTLSYIYLDGNQTTDYYVGDSFSFTGKCYASYTDGSYAAVTPTSVSSPDMTSAGTKTVTVSYTEGGVTKTTTYDITVSAKTLSSLAKSGTLSKTSYYAGESFDYTGLTFTATFSDSSTLNVSSQVAFSPSPLTAGTTSVTASYTYGGTTKTVTVSGLTVVTKTLQSLSKSGTPTKTSYNAGESFNASGLTVTATFNGGTEDVTSSVVWTPSPLTAGTTSVTGTYTYNNVSKTVTVTGLTVTATVQTYTVTINKSNSGLSTTATTATTDKSYAIESTGKNLDVTWGVGVNNNASYDEISFASTSSTILSSNSNALVSSISLDCYSYSTGYKVMADGVEVSSTEGTGGSGTVLVYTFASSTSNWSIIHDTTYTRHIYSLSIVVSGLPQDVAVTGVTVQPQAASIAVGGTTTLTASVLPSNASNKAVTWSSNNTSVATVSDSGVVTGVAAGSATITVATVDGGYKATCLINVTASSSSGSYEKVTSSDDLTDGTYLIVYESGNLAFNGSLATLDATSNTISVTISSSKISSTTTIDASSFTIAKSGSNYTIKAASGKYIGTSGDSNGLSTSTTALNNTITIGSDGNATIVSSGGAYLRYNSDSSQARFRYYKSSSYTNQKAIQLYKLASSASSGYTADNFATDFLNALTCDVTGNSAPTLSLTWTELKTKFNSIDTSTERAKLTNATYSISGSGSNTVVTATGTTTDVVALAMSRYDILISKYSSTYSDNFIGRPASAQQNMFITQSESSTTMMIVIVSIISISAISGFIFLKKRKEN